MMETSSLVAPRPGGYSRLSKALPEPPPSFKDIKDLVSPVRQDALPSRPPLPRKDTAVRPRASSTVAARPMESALPPLPGSERIIRPPTVMLKRKPVGSGSNTETLPNPQPMRGVDMSPVESLSSLQRDPGTKTSASPKGSIMEQSSPPKLLPRDTLEEPTAGLSLISPLYLSSPVSSRMEKKDVPQPQPGAVHEEIWASRPLPPPPPPKKDIRRPTTPKSRRAPASTPNELAGASPKSQTSPSSSQSQLWRRRSLKSDRTLTVAELKLASTNGSTAATSLAQDLSSSKKPLPPSAGPGQDPRSLESYDSFPDRSIRPSASNRSLRSDPSPNLAGYKKPKEDVDAFAQYAQELEDGIAEGTYERPSASPARPPEIRCPPTPEPESEKGSNELRIDIPTSMSPATPVFPVTPPSEGRPLSMIPEDFVKNPSSRSRSAMSPHPPPSGPLPALPPRSSSRPSPSQRSHAPPGRASPGAAASPAAAGRAASSPRYATTTTTTTTTANAYRAAAADERGAAVDSPAPPGDGAGYLPTGQYSRLFPPGSIIPAPPLRATQLDCFGGHALLVPSRNEAHPVGCMACGAEDRGPRFTCSHCSARVCGACCDALVANGRDLRGLVRALRDE